MSYDTFARNLTVFCDTREKEAAHIYAGLDALGVRRETRKLDLGDYSFCVGDADFRLSCVVERKASVDELYGNIMQVADRSGNNRLMRELSSCSRQINQLVFLIEQVGSLDELRDYVLPEYKMQMSPQRVVCDIGRTCYNALCAWQLSNRYRFIPVFIRDTNDTAREMVKIFYSYWTNYRRDIAVRRS